ncbi:alpha/beta hydrolase family protein [Prosthecobacter fusiformis]|uniref:Alpha/beta hydrolase family protein n=1 Tax=Prosthecobacter fusiformis TaxID=48464 RepID=A0A4R7SQF6_9BACT|nr:alpha/beta hydrolase [Prosthecobacter fusiformis]TDU81470.1 alpha/beta hydrolase family protein [Prosthecobacter fusiformis]
MNLFRLFSILTALLCTQVASAEKSSPQIIADIVYQKGQASAYAAERCKLDLYLPAVQKDFPTLVWLHGGGLTSGSKDSEKQVALARHFAEEGVAVAMVNYRLSPKATYPAYIEDSSAAFAWVKKNIQEHGGDAGRVFLGGHSAGAYLALMVSLDAHYLEAQGLTPDAICGLIPISGQTLTHYTVRIERGQPKERLMADEASPLFHVCKEAPPMLILYADKDMEMRVEENALLASALRAAGHEKTTTSMIKGRTHSSVAHDMANAGDVGFAEVMGFIQAVKAE